MNPSKDQFSSDDSGSPKGFFLSDLHLFSRRSHADVYWKQFYETVERAHTLILGGDIFDFKWSTRPSLGHSIAEAIRWLDDLAVAYPNCALYYLLGNHDAHPDFVAELDRLAFDKPKIVWQPYFLRLGSCVFLHGDVVDGEPDHEMLEARRRASENRPSPRAYRHFLYDAVVQARLHSVVARVAVRQGMVLKKLSQYLTSHGMDASSGVTDIYFGHTHREMDGVEYYGLRYHNGGASIKGIGFRIVETRLTCPSKPLEKPSNSSDSNGP